MNKNLNRFSAGDKISKSQADKFHKHSEAIDYNLIEVKITDNKLSGIYCAKFRGYSEMKNDDKNNDKFEQLLKLLMNLSNRVDDNHQKDQEFKDEVLKRLEKIEATQAKHGEILKNHDKRLAKIEDRLTSLEGRVTVLESYHQNLDN
ncbi:hypothetical protein ACW95P_01190 [Candidatus Mycoplasma pogonae]